MTQNIWFTSDQHYSHGLGRPHGIIELANRPFSSVEEMNEAMVENFNARVGRQDLTYHLGDFCWNQQDGQKILRRLNGHHVLIVGNHDKSSKALNGWMEIVMAKEIKIDERPIYLHHYGCRVWNRCFRDAYHFYGHSHNRLPGNSQSCDVGVDAWNFRPVNLEEIEARLVTLPRYVPEDYIPGERDSNASVS